MPLLPGANPLLVLATILSVGVLFGSLAKRLHLPRVTGQILIGVLIGSSGLHLFDHDAVNGLQPMTHFALGLMAVTIGAHLNLRRLRNAGKRLFLLVLFESTLTPVLVYVALRFGASAGNAAALLCAAIAISTAPATIVALVQESRARGVFVKTLVAAVALNNVACILLFELARTAVQDDLGLGGGGGTATFIEPLEQLGAAIALGAAGALILTALTRIGVVRERLATAGITTILLVSGSASYFEASPLLACLFLGFLQANVLRERKEIADRLFADFQPAILAAFFTLAGMELNLDEAKASFLIAVPFVVARATGKYFSADWAMRLAGATDRVRKNLGFALIPQAGVAVGLVVLLEEEIASRGGDRGVSDVVVTVVLTAVVIAELIGPILTRLALVRSGEAGMDRTRLVDFIQEENIVTSFHSESVEQAIEQLVDLMVRTHHLSEKARGPILESALRRERQASTCFGNGLAVPHGILPDSERMIGVMALSAEGLAFKTPDDKPVHCLVLLATPGNERDRHLQVLSMLAGTIGLDPEMAQRLYNSDSPAHAYELLHGKRAEGFNYFLEG